MTTLIPHFIAGQPFTGEGRRAPVYDPARGSVRGELVLADAALVGQAVATARAAFPGWAATPALQRARVLFRFRDLLEQQADALAALITAEHGKTLDDARGEVTRGLEVVEFACGIPHLLKGEYSASVGRGVDS